MERRFVARLRGTETGPAYVEVPAVVMRSLHWSRSVRALATINRRVTVPVTIMNVGYGPSFLVPASACGAAGARVNEAVDVTVSARE